MVSASFAQSEQVVRAVAAARAAWPDIALDPVAFTAALAAAVDGVAGAVGGLCVDDLYLAQACAAGDRRALAAFDRDWLGKVPQFLARHAARPQVDEVRQRVRERLLVASEDAPARIATYGGRGPLIGWVRVATLRVASNLLRGERRGAPLLETPADGLLAAITDEPGSARRGSAAELRVLEGAYREAFRAAFRAAVEALTPEERTILRLHHVDGVTVRKLAPILDVSTATAGRRILAAQERLRAAVVQQLAAQVAAPEGDVVSVVRALMSRLDVSMSALT